MKVSILSIKWVFLVLIDDAEVTAAVKPTVVTVERGPDVRDVFEC